MGAVSHMWLWDGSQECPGKAQSPYLHAVSDLGLLCHPLFVAGPPRLRTILKMRPVGDIDQTKCFLVSFPKHIDNSPCRLRCQLLGPVRLNNLIGGDLLSASGGRGRARASGAMANVRTGPVCPLHLLIF